MKKVSIILAFVLGAAVIYMFGQSYGSVGFGPIAPALSNCPAGTANTAQLCAVGTAASNYTMYVSYNGAAYQLLAPAGTAMTGTAPIVVSGGTVSCPTCVQGSVVTSFNGRTGAATLTKADVTGTGVAVSTTATSTIQ